RHVATGARWNSNRGELRPQRGRLAGHGVRPAQAAASSVFEEIVVGDRECWTCATSGWRPYVTAALETPRVHGCLRLKPGCCGAGGEYAASEGSPLARER